MKQQEKFEQQAERSRKLRYFLQMTIHCPLILLNVKTTKPHALFQASAAK
jgi:hypothetical protein